MSGDFKLGNKNYFKEFTDEEIQALLSISLSKGYVWYDSSKGAVWDVTSFRTLLKEESFRFPSLNFPFKDLPLHLNKNPLARSPAEDFFTQEIAKWRLQIGK